jgi:hypothetical protein
VMMTHMRELHSWSFSGTKRAAAGEKEGRKEGKRDGYTQKRKSRQERSEKQGKKKKSEKKTPLSETLCSGSAEWNQSPTATYWYLSSTPSSPSSPSFRSQVDPSVELGPERGPRRGPEIGLERGLFFRSQLMCHVQNLHFASQLMLGMCLTVCIPPCSSAPGLT